jgi:UDP-N-acetyl-D-mannosaminouronate:lipid I N-acetyl-D-mannosaminouronosyltransferase
MSNSCLINDIKTYSFKSKNELIEFVNDKKTILIAINAEKIIYAKKSLSEIIKKNIGYPDGIGAVWALKKRGFKDAIKIPGVELWLDIIEKYNNNKSFYLVGAKQDVIFKTVEKLKNNYPGIEILNYRNGYFNSVEEKYQLFDDIKNAKPDVVFVAAGSPNQELLMEEMFEHYPALYMGLGGSFDVYSGNVKRAPQFWINLHMEWFYRLIKQPRRLKRQFNLIRFAFLSIIGRV